MLEFDTVANDVMDDVAAKILVIGVGGGGGNAVERMIACGLEGADFMLANTDKQVLFRGQAPRKLLLGENVTGGKGAGGKAEVGRQAAEESVEELRNALTGYDMVFITAGMGGGTGTGAAPIVAKLAREQGILTVGIVTKPFFFEGPRRMKQAKEGIEALSEQVDSLIVIANDRLLEICDEKTSMLESFSMADDILRQGVQGISDMIYRPGIINLDFADVRSVMSNHGFAHMGIGRASGEGKAAKAAEIAISSPLLDTTVAGARELLVNVCGNRNLGMRDIQTVMSSIYALVDEDANVVFGSSIDDGLNDEIIVTVIATDFPADRPIRPYAPAKPQEKEPEPVKPPSSPP